MRIYNNKMCNIFNSIESRIVLQTNMLNFVQKSGPWPNEVDELNIRYIVVVLFSAE